MSVTMTETFSRFKLNNKNMFFVHISLYILITEYQIYYIFIYLFSYIYI